MGLRFYKEIKQTLSIIKKKESLYLGSVGITFVMMSLIFALLFFTSYKISQNLIELQQIITQVAPFLSGDLTDYTAAYPILEQAGKIKSYYFELQMYALMMVVGFLVIWIIMGSINWFMTEKIIFKAKKFFTYFIKFSLLSIVWYLLFLLISSMIYIPLSSLLKQNAASIVNILYGIYFLLILMLLYFANISSARCSVGLKILMSPSQSGKIVW